MDCSYFAAGICRSCTFLETPYAEQLAAKQARVEAALAGVAPGLRWHEPVRSAEAGFRNKAKMVVGGTVDAPLLGILGPDGRGVDLQGCGLHTPGLTDALPILAAFVTTARLTPYSVPDRTGELKHLIVTESPDGELMVRFVLRSTEALARLRSRLPALLAEGERIGRPIAVVSVNIQPEHKAILEGPEEILLHGETLLMRVNEISLHLRPQSFFQTNTDVAGALYRAASELVDAADPRSVWDLYCGVGGFGLHVARPGRTVLGVEVSEQAIESAKLSAAELGVADSTEWLAADATTWIRGLDTSSPGGSAYSTTGSRPDVVIVNPPRRGIGPDLAGWLEASGVPNVVYSSCNADSLARDLAAMPSLRVTSARLLDMFPHTNHHEVLVQLSR
jgi:23S rRNA (uracil747-C5)-methyltransferase